MTDKLENALKEYGDGLAPADKDFIADIIGQIIGARYYGQGEFPVGHPEFQERIQCEACYGQGTWEAECCNGSGGCSCHGVAVQMGNCRVCHGSGYRKKNANLRANSESIAGYGYLGDGGNFPMPNCPALGKSNF